MLFIFAKSINSIGGILRMSDDMFCGSYCALFVIPGLLKARNKVFESRKCPVQVVQ